MSNPIELGADPSGTQDSTQILQDILDREQRLLLPAGTFLIHSLQLRSGMHLELSEGSALRALQVHAAYSEFTPFIHIQNAEGVRISGPGQIRGGGPHWYKPSGLRIDGPHPRHCILAQNCTNLVIDGPTLSESVIWTCKIEDCRDVQIRNLCIRNPVWVFAQCTDGIDVVCSENVLIEDCDIETGDDAICIKSHKGEPEFADWRPEDFQPVRNVTVRRCRLACNCSAAKVGTETASAVEGVLFEDLHIVMHPGAVPDAVPGNPRPSCAATAALAVYSVDGAHVRDVCFRNCRIERAAAPIHIQLQRRSNRTQGPIGSIEGIRFEQIRCEYAEIASCIEGDGGIVRDVELRDCRIITREAPGPIRIPPRPSGRHPSCRLYDHLPAFGLWTRCAEELRLIDCHFEDQGNSSRPAILHQEPDAEAIDPS